MRSSILFLGIILGPLAVVACGDSDGSGGSGLDGSQTVVGLSAGDKQTFCTWAIQSQGGAGTVHECEGFTLTVQTVAECVADFDQFSATCTATVDQAEACISAISSNPCDPATTACDAIFACIPE